MLPPCVDLPHWKPQAVKQPSNTSFVVLWLNTLQRTHLPLAGPGEWAQNEGSTKYVRSRASYTDETSNFVPTERSGHRRYFHQHAYDFLLGIEVDGEPVYPHHLREGSATAAQRYNFAINVRRNYMLKEFHGRHELLHERKPGHRSFVSGERNSGFGWRLIPRKDEIADLVAMVSYGGPKIHFELSLNPTYYGRT